MDVIQLILVHLYVFERRATQGSATISPDAQANGIDLQKKALQYFRKAPRPQRVALVQAVGGHIPAPPDACPFRRQSGCASSAPPRPSVVLSSSSLFSAAVCVFCSVLVREPTGRCKPTRHLQGEPLTSSCWCQSSNLVTTRHAHTSAYKRALYAVVAIQTLAKPLSAPLKLAGTRDW